MLQTGLAPLDGFADSFSFQLPKGKSRYHTRTTIVSSICLIGILVTYSVLKLESTLSNADTKVESRIVDRYFDEDDVFNIDKHRNGFQIAFGYTGYPDDNVMRYEPEYAELKLVLKEWGHGVEGVTFTKIDVRPCNDEELGLGLDGFADPRSRFYPIA